MNSFENISGLTDSMKIYLNINDVTFNPVNWDLLKNSNFSKTDLLKKLIIKNSSIYNLYINNHFYFGYPSFSKKNYFVCTNLTSSSHLMVKNSINEFYSKKLEIGFNPNLTGQIKFNYFTPIHECNLNNEIINSIPKNIIQKMNSFSHTAENYILFNFREPLFIYENKEFIEKKISIFECCKNNNYIILEKLKSLDEFEHLNKEFLLTKEGENCYNLIKQSILYNNNW